ncbi:MAG TPA: hypothetical protein VGT41_00720 [Candidatus Babeliales bacterium]|nr:hypothetical protein [Candidatus Babeliales bacterium]
MNLMSKKALLSMLAFAAMQTNVAFGINEQEQAQVKFWEAAEGMSQAERTKESSIRARFNVIQSTKNFENARSAAASALSECDRQTTALPEKVDGMINAGYTFRNTDKPALVDSGRELTGTGPVSGDSLQAGSSSSAGADVAERSDLEKIEKGHGLSDEYYTSRFAGEVTSGDTPEMALDTTSFNDFVESDFGLGYKDRAKNQLASIWATLGNHRKKSVAAVVAVAAIGAVMASDELREQVGVTATVQAVRTRLAQSAKIQSAKVFVKEHQDTLKKVALGTAAVLAAAFGGKKAWQYFAKKA